MGDMRDTFEWFREQHNEPACSAIGGRRGVGKIINIKPCRAKPKWCPLIET